MKALPSSRILGTIAYLEHLYIVIRASEKQRVSRSRSEEEKDPQTELLGLTVQGQWFSGKCLRVQARGS